MDPPVGRERIVKPDNFARYSDRREVQLFPSRVYVMHLHSRRTLAARFPIDISSPRAELSIRKRIEFVAEILERPVAELYLRNDSER